MIHPQKSDFSWRTGDGSAPTPENMYLPPLKNFVVVSARYIHIGIDWDSNKWFYLKFELVLENLGTTILIQKRGAKKLEIL